MGRWRGESGFGRSTEREKGKGEESGKREEEESIVR